MSLRNQLFVSEDNGTVILETNPNYAETMRRIERLLVVLAAASASALIASLVFGIVVAERGWRWRAGLPVSVKRAGGQGRDASSRHVDPALVLPYRLLR